ncbi:MAG: hypothetical protein GY746_10540 [Gammaproteobacteria bacterium]|nr:hypothetical protein [Gammaproteobacteria bacterium]
MTNQPYRIARFQKALVHFISGRAVQASARAILILVLVRLLDVADYGAYMLIIGLSETLLLVASLGILPVGQRYLPQMLTTLPIKKLYAFVASLAASQIAILSLIAIVLGKYWSVLTPYIGFSAEQTTATYIAVWLFLLIPAFRFSVEMLDALLEQGKAQITRALMPTARVTGIGVLLLTDLDINLTNIFIIDISVTAFCLLLAYSFLHNALGNLHSSKARGTIPTQEILRFARHMAIVGLMGATSSPGAVRLALANVLGVVESGLFAFLQSLQRLIGRYLPGTLLRGLVRPVLVARTQDADGIAILESGSGLLLKSNLIIVAAGTIVIAIAGNETIAWVSGGKFLDAGLTLLLMFIALAVSSQRMVIEMVMQITGHTAALRATSLISPIALLAVWLFADHGLNIAVVIMAFAAALANWIAIAILIKSTGEFKIDWRGQMAVLLPATLIIAASFPLTTTLNPFIIAILSIPIFILLIRITKPFKSSETAIIERSLGQRAARLIKGFSSS